LSQVAHPKRIAIGGHSYGAFMTANLLVHAADLFCCGIGRSGAYNRTLTPFGFQVEFSTSRLYTCISFATPDKRVHTQLKPDSACTFEEIVDVLLFF
jgi:predicted esterase